MSNGIKKRLNQNVSLGAVIFSVVLLLSVVGISFYFGILKPRSEYRSTTRIVISEIMKTTLASADGSKHSLEARFAVDVDRGLENSTDMALVFDIINQVLSELDYDRLTGYNNLDYVKALIMRELENNGNINMDAIAGIYATDFSTDFPVNPDSLPKSSTVSDVFKGLFKSAK